MDTVMIVEYEDGTAETLITDKPDYVDDLTDPRRTPVSIRKATPKEIRATPRGNW